MLPQRAGWIELMHALLEGSFEASLWQTFLDQLRRLTNADFAALMIQPPGWDREDSLHLVSGDHRPEESNALYARHFQPKEVIRTRFVPEGVPQSLEELRRIDGGAHERFFDELKKGQGVSAYLGMRVEEDSGVNAWLTVARRKRNFSQEDSETLIAIAPILRSVLRQYVAREQDRHSLSLADEAITALQYGWLTLDVSGKIVGANAFGARLLKDGDVLARRADGRLKVTPPAIEREVLQAIRKLAEKPQSAPKPIFLCQDPWIDMLLVPARQRFVATTGAAAVIAYVHRDNWRSVDRCGQLVEMFALKPSEARLALALCRGRKISEAAEEVGLSVETARVYSKSIYAKTGARGMADLVRIIMGSVLALAPPT